MNEVTLLSRRGFLKVTSCVSGLVIALGRMPIPGVSAAGPGASQADHVPQHSAPEFAPNAYIRISRAGVVTLILDKDEVGQGVATSLPMLLAEELEVGLDQVRVEPAPPNDKLYADPILHFQATGNSTSVRANWQGLREAGAACRMMLLTAAAQRWKAHVEDCRAERGEIIHEPSGRRVSYGALVDSAARVPVPPRVPLKEKSRLKLIGTSPLRLDLPGKVNGQAQYGIDIRLPDMKFASLNTCPVFGGTLASVDDSRALELPGVERVIRLPDAVAVIANNTWIAFEGLKLLQVRWNEGPHAHVTLKDVVAGLQTAAQRPGVLAHQEGNPDQAQNHAAQHLQSTYQDPFLAHAPMEPVNCVASVADGACEVWTSSQVQARAQVAAAQAAGVPAERVTLHNLMAGGAFGRRLETDFISKSVSIARQLNAPVKVTWTREEDIRRDLYRPYYLDRIAADLDSRGRIMAWRHRIVGSSVMARFAPPALGPNGLDPDAVDCASQPIYAFQNYRVDYVRCEPPGVPTAFWRGVGPTHNVFVMESFVDECATAAKQDPVAYRRSMLQQSPRALRTLEVASGKAGWGGQLPARAGRGIAVVNVFDTYLSVVVQVSVGRDGGVRLQRVVCAVDCGTVVHPDTVVAQIEGGVLFGLSAALFNQITLAGGRVQQSNFNDYRTLRIDEVPPVEVHLIPNGDAPGGVGETGTVGAAPALANAIFAATGVRIRRLPVVANKLAVALLMSFCVGVMTAFGQAPLAPGFELANSSKLDVARVFAKPDASPRWGSPLPDSFVRAGVKASIRVPTETNCLYDVRVVLADGRAEDHPKVDVCKHSLVTVSPRQVTH